MANWDVVDPPRGLSYGAPNMAPFLAGGIGSLPDAYFQGQQNQAALEQAKPILGPDGKPVMDPFKIMQEGFARRGGGALAQQNAQNLLKFYMGQQYLKAITDVPDPHTENPNASPSPWPTPGPTPGPTSSAAPPKVRPDVASATSPDNLRPNDLLTRAPTVNGLARAAYLPASSADRIAATLGVDPNQRLSATEMRQVQYLLSRSRYASNEPQSLSGRSVDYGDQSSKANAETDGSAVSTSAADLASSPGPRPLTRGGASGGPAPGPSNAFETPVPGQTAPQGERLPSTPVVEATQQRQGNQTAPVPNQRVAQAFAQATPPPVAGAPLVAGSPPVAGPPPIFQRPSVQPPAGQEPASSLVPPQWRGREQQYVQKLRNAAANATKAANYGSVAGYDTKPALDKAAQYNKEADEISAALQKSRTPTDTEANIEAARRTAVQAADVKHSDDLYNGMQSLGNASAGMVDNVKLQQSLVNNPDFYSGTAENAALFLKRTIPSLAGSSAPMELYKKVLNANMLHLIDNMKASQQEMGASSSRIFGAQIEQIEKASGTLDNSPLGLRSLAEINARTLQRNIQLADFASDYKRGKYSLLPKEFTEGGTPGVSGTLDANFEKGLRKWLSNNPMLTAQEQNDPRTLGAHVVPDTVKTKAQLQAWEASLHLTSGQPIRAPDGKVHWIP